MSLAPPRSLACALLLLACGHGAGPLTTAESASPRASEQKSEPAATDAAPSHGPASTEPVLQFHAETVSPRRGVPAPKLAALQKRCGAPDAGLAEVAENVAVNSRIGDSDDVDRLAFSLRAAGIPYVWPRAWTFASQGGAIPLGEAEERLVAWAAGFGDGGQRRCGLALRVAPEGETLVAVVADVLADLVKPLPTQARTGQWLELSAKLLEPVTGAKLVVVGPTGDPATLPTTLAGDEVRARFAVGAPGPWLVQLLGVGRTGPRPVIEAWVQSGGPPPTQYHGHTVPGEAAAAGVSDPTEAMSRMVASARQLEGRTALARHPELDRLATEHAQAMLKAGHIGHDVGDGGPQTRVERAGFHLKKLGENVAHAADAPRAHRALWASPSHRSNLLHRGFTHFGLGLARDPDGTLWVCELFGTW